MGLTYEMVLRDRQDVDHVCARPVVVVAVVLVESDPVQEVQVLLLQESHSQPRLPQLLVHLAGVRKSIT